MENGEKGRMPSLDDVMRAVLPEDSQQAEQECGNCFEGKADPVTERMAEGAAAARAGTGISDNPYVSGYSQPFAEAHDWQRGYDRAKQAELVEPAPVLDPKDLRIDTYSSRPLASWVHHTITGVRIIHLPTGLEAICETERSQHANKDKALAALAQMVALRRVEQAPAQDEREAYSAWCDSNTRNRRTDTNGCHAFKAGAAWQRTRPAQTEQQPVAYADPQAFVNFGKARQDGIEAGPRTHEWMWANPGSCLVPLYAAPIAQTVPRPTGLSQGWNLVRQCDGFVIGHSSEEPSQRHKEQALADGRIYVPFLVAQTAPQPEQSGLYTCIGKGGSYELIGRATTAGALKVTGRFADEVIVYRDTESSALYCRAPGDFRLRMARAALSAQGDRDE